MALEVGQRVGDYEVLALLGAGGMGRVYKVRNIISNREEAMKVLLPDIASEPELAARFMAEIRTLAGLEHPNIAQLRTAFQYQNEFVMIMEFVEGATMEKLATESMIPLDRVLDYSSQALSALSYAHGRGVTHRDIKPANIMVTSHGLVKLMDFGIAKGTNDMQLTRPGTTMGSVYYMSPEQVQGGTVDARSDIYSFGVTLYEMLTGRKPFHADSSYSVLYAQMNEMPTPPVQVNPAVPPELNDIVLHAMEKRPEARFQSAEEFRDALKAVRKPHAAQSSPQPEGFARVAVAASAAAVPQQGVAPVPLSATAAATQPPRTPAPVTLPATAVMPQPPSFTPVSVSAPAASQPQGFTPVPVAVPPASVAAPGAGKSHRGLWIGLGALAALLALVAAATVLPRLFSTHASQKSEAVATATPTPAPSPAAGSVAQPASPAANAAQQPSPASPAAPEASPSADASGSQPSSALTPSSSTKIPPRRTSSSSAEPADAAPAAPASGAAAAPAGPSPQEIRQVHDRLMNLDARADAARSGVQQIRSQQQAQGYDIRGDILAAMNRMNSNLGEANRALEQNNPHDAEEYLDRAEREASTLEKFLGR